MNELKGAVELNGDAQSLLLRLYPIENTFPMSLDDILKNFSTRRERDGMPRFTGKYWTGAPKLNKPGPPGERERELSEWLNSIADDILEMLPAEKKSGVEKFVQWSGDYSRMSLPADGLQEDVERKPDILGLDQKRCGDSSKDDDK